MADIKGSIEHKNAWDRDRAFEGMRGYPNSDEYMRNASNALVERDMNRDSERASDMSWQQRDKSRSKSSSRKKGRSRSR